MAPDSDDDEFAPEDFDDDPTDDRPRSTVKRASRPGQMLGAAMLGLGEILQPKPKQEIPVQFETPGEPPDIDRKGLDEVFGAEGKRLSGPPLDTIKSRAALVKRIKRRR
ncbi:MAG: hypothetical protein RL219_2315 [Actinomycetota bacterium]